GVDEVETRGRSPVPEEPRLHVLGAERLAQERVVEQVDLPDGEVVGRAPVGIEEPELLRRKRAHDVRPPRSGHVTERNAPNADRSELATAYACRRDGDRDRAAASGPRGPGRHPGPLALDLAGPRERP